MFLPELSFNSISFTIKPSSVYKFIAMLECSVPLNTAMYAQYFELTYSVLSMCVACAYCTLGIFLFLTICTPHLPPYSEQEWHRCNTIQLHPVCRHT